MERRETGLEEAVVEHLAHELVAAVAGAETVAVAEAETRAADFNLVRLTELDHSELLEIAVGPDIVVAGEEIHLDTRVHEVQERREHPYISFRDDVAVFVPEIPDVAEQIQRIRLRSRNSFQERDETRFAPGGIGHLETEVDVGDEI